MNCSSADEWKPFRFLVTLSSNTMIADDAESSA